MSRIRTTLALGCATAVMLPALAAPAAAGPLERLRETFTDTWEFECGDVLVAARADVTANIVFVARGPSGLPQWQASIQEHGVHTNTETGRTYSWDYIVSDRDHRVTDNGDGTLTILVQVSGVTRWMDADGKLLYLDSGTLQAEWRVDHNGTPDDPFDDGESEFLGIVRDLTGRTDTSGRDFCADFLEVTG